MADIERWITVNGVHIPIMRGESKARAVGNFIRDRRNKLKEKYETQKNKASEALRKSGNENRRVKDLNTEATNTYMKLQEQRKTIKGRVKTKEEKLDELSDKAGDWEMMKDEARQRGSYEDYKTAKAKFERYDRQYEKEKARPTARYKLKEDKETKTQKSEGRFLGYGDLHNPNEYYGTHDRRRLATKSRSGKSTRGRARRY